VKSVELRLAFGELEPADICTYAIYDSDERSTKENEPDFETSFHSYWSQGSVGQGGAGTVFMVRDEDHYVFAIKRLDPDKVSAIRVKRFENELNFSRKRSHQNLINVVGDGFTIVKGVKVPFYVMPYYAKTLRRLMADGISVDMVLPYFGQILDGIEAAHLLGASHRDLKPENILYDPELGTLVIADFGIAHFEEDDLHTAVETRDGERLANFLYAAPEQKTRGRTAGLRADIYALGLILNEMFTREVPQGQDYRGIASVARQFVYLDGIVTSMIQQEPEKRPVSIDAVKNLLRARGDEFISRQN